MHAFTIAYICIPKYINSLSMYDLRLSCPRTVIIIIFHHNKYSQKVDALFKCIYAPSTCMMVMAILLEII